MAICGDYGIFNMERINRKIYVVGSLNMDLTIKSPRLPKKGETITGSDFLTNPGGKGANQALAASLLGGKVMMCGAVGDDVFGQTLIENLIKAQVDVDAIKCVRGESTGVAMIIVSSSDNRIILDKGSNAKLSEVDIASFLSKSTAGDIYLTQLENPVGVIGAGLKMAKEKGLYTILNPAPADCDIAPFFQYVDLFVPNETELAAFGGKKALFTAGIKKIVTTLGRDGYEVSDVTSSQKYPCLQVNAVDTTAAGDTLCGGLAAGLGEGKNLEDALFFASLAASIACSRRGASSSIPSREEVECFLAKNRI